MTGSSVSVGAVSAGAVLPPRPAADAAQGPTAQELDASVHYMQRLLLCGGGGGGGEGMQ